MTELYNPLTYRNLMAGLAAHFQREVSKRPLSDALDSNPVAPGPGVYALYYAGSLGVYQPIQDGETPIYVGKADPPGGRKGGGELDTDDPTLHKRLREHARSIRSARNLHLEDFQFRGLPVEPVWIRLAERFLIEAHKPVWNIALDGFGKHDSGRARRSGERSWWDTLHPGRAWALQESGARTEDEAACRVRAFFAERRD